MSRAVETIRATEAKQHFGALLDRVQHDPVAITKQGRPVAMMLPVRDQAMLEVVQQAIDDAWWGARANKAIEKGYLGTEASTKLVDDVLNVSE